MKALKVYFIDAFAENQFEGNPAAVIPLEKWLPDHVMQALAAENNLSETAFFVERNGSYRIRWFTPVDEVKLCGHATLASAYVLFYELGYEQDVVRFKSLSGELYVRRAGRNIVLDFPVQAPTRCDAPLALIDGLGENPVDVLTNCAFASFTISHAILISSLFQWQDSIITLTILPAAASTIE